MTRHPLKAFFRRGQPVPLTCNDFAHRHGCERQESIDAIAALHRDGFVREGSKQHPRFYELTDMGLRHSRLVLCIPEGLA